MILPVLYGTSRTVHSGYETHSLLRLNRSLSLSIFLFFHHTHFTVILSPALTVNSFRAPSSHHTTSNGAHISRLIFQVVANARTSFRICIYNILTPLLIVLLAMECIGVCMCIEIARDTRRRVSRRKQMYVLYLYICGTIFSIFVLYVSLLLFLSLSVAMCFSRLSLNLNRCLGRRCYYLPQ